MAKFTVVFADLTGSTGVIESLGNIKATQAITRLTQWISQTCETHGGCVVKSLGDGVLVLFKESHNAVNAGIELQQVHQNRIRKWPEPLRMQLQLGMARGDIVEQDGDCYGDAVNLASRLSDISGPEQILVSDTVIQQMPDSSLVRSRCMGPMVIRGRAESCVVHRIEWQSEVLSEIFTMPAILRPSSFFQGMAKPAFIKLSWLDMSACFSATELPVFLGRDSNANFVVQDPRVSRKHAQIVWRANDFYLEDISTYGTWVRFANSSTIIGLRRQECLLLQDGEIALGASFDDFTVPNIAFEFSSSAQPK